MKTSNAINRSFTNKIERWPVWVISGLALFASSLTIVSSLAANASETTKPANKAAKSPSGEPMPIAAPAGWKRTFSEDFTTNAALGQFPNSPAYASKWGAYDGFKDTSKHGTYSTAKVLSVSDGLLDMYLHTEGETHYVAAPIPNRWKGQVYGRYSVRFKSDSIPQYKTAWLLWPVSDKWDEGEIDFPEGNLDSTISAFSHCANVNNPSANCGTASTNSRYTTWHTATTEWTKGEVVWWLDGVKIGSCTKNVPNTPMRWTLQTETQLGSAPPSTVKGHVSIDWVTIDSPG